MGFDEETGLQYLCLLNDFRRFSEMVLNRYEQLSRGQVAYIGVVSYAHAEFMKSGTHGPLRTALDKFFSWTPQGSLRTQLLLLDQYVNVITHPEWRMSAQFGNVLPQRIRSVHFHCHYSRGGQNWDMDPGLKITIHVQKAVGSEKLELFVMEEERMIYGPQLTRYKKVEKDFNVRQVVFDYVLKIMGD